MLRLTIPADMQARLIKALRRAGKRECGGVLMGEHVGANHFVVRQFTVQKSGTIAAFVRCISGVSRAIKAYCHANGNDYKRFNYLGEWHSHPLFSVQPSAIDHATMRSLVTDPLVGANFAVLLVLRLRDCGLEGSAHTYLPDGSIHFSNLDLEDAE